MFALALLALVSTSVCGTAGALKGVRTAAELHGAARRVTADGRVGVGIVDGAMRLRGGGKKDKAEAKEETGDGDEKMEDKEPAPRSAMDMPEIQDPNEYEPGDRPAPSSQQGPSPRASHQPPRDFPHRPLRPSVSRDAYAKRAPFPSLCGACRTTFAEHRADST